MSGFVVTPGAVQPGCADARAPRRLARNARAEPAGGTWLDWLGAMLRTVATRRYLAEMDDRMLKDIGVTRADALQEAGRVPWDLGPRNC
jgi:uncharacterized protein YjiS (DUF1127 family)